MGKNMIADTDPHDPKTDNELTAQRAQDSTSMVTTALHNPPIPAIPMAARVLLACRMSRMIIMRVRRTLSEREIEKYGRPNELLLVGCAD